MITLQKIQNNIQRDKSSINVIPSKIHEDYKELLKVLLDMNKHNILDKIDFYMCYNSQYHYYKNI